MRRLQVVTNHTEEHLGPKGKVLNFAEARSRKFLEDLRDHSFLALVLYPDGTIGFFEKGVTPDEWDTIRQTIEDKLAEGDEHGGR